MVFNISPRISLPLSALMVVFSLTLIALPNDAIDESKKPLFTGWRNPDGEFFAAGRLEKAFVHYYLLHALPATIWSIVMPLQYWDTLRRSRPGLHRFTGYVAASCSLCLTITGLAFIPQQLSFSKPIFTMHSIYGIPSFPSSNFALAFGVAPAMLLTGSRAIYLARHKRFAEHRRWAVYHGISGYLITLQRLWMFVVNGLGSILEQNPELQRLLGTDSVRSLKAKSDAELAAFAFTVYAAGISSIVWILYLRRQNAASSGKIKLN